MKNNKSGNVEDCPAFAVDQSELVLNDAILPHVSGAKVRNGTSGNLIITWKCNSRRKMADSSDIVFFSVFPVKSDKHLDIPDAALRMDGVYILNASRFKGKLVDICMGLCNQDGNFFSDPLIFENVMVSK